MVPYLPRGCRFLIFILGVLSCRAVWADDIVVEASRIRDDRAAASSTVTVLDENEIRRRNAPTVADLLREIPGVEIVRQGGVGQTTSIFIRGSRSEDTLVLIDGIEANDAMSPACGFDFSSLSPAGVERIEVYRGPQSVRFGSGALGGVINIVTKEGRGARRWGYLAEGGSYSTVRGGLAVSGAAPEGVAGAPTEERPELSYFVGAERLATKGFSAANEKYGNSETDGADVKSASAKVRWNPAGPAALTATLRYAAADVDLDRRGGPGGDDPNDRSQARQAVAGLLAEDRFWQERLKSTLAFAYSEVDRADLNSPDAGSADSSSSHFLSESQKIQSDHDVLLSEALSLRLGIQWRDESGVARSLFNGADSSVGRQRQSVLGEALTAIFDDGTWQAEAGIRSDRSSQAGPITSDRFSLGRHAFGGASLLTLTYGTGFKLPSLYQLYSAFGNRDLFLENSETTEASFEQKIGPGLIAHVTVFESRFRNLIDYDLTTNRYFNVSRAKSRGAELQSTWRATPRLTADASYGYLESFDELTGQALIRRPQNTWTMATRYAQGNFEGALRYRRVGERPDVDPTTFQRITDDAYGTLGLNGFYQISKPLKITARIENMLNEKYEEAAGYGTAGLSFYVGLTGEM